MSHLSQPLAAAVRYLISIINQFAQYPFPGTNIPVIGIMAAVWGLFFFWRWLLSTLFDVEWKR